MKNNYYEDEPDSVGAAFFIGQYYEQINELDQALRYYRHAGACASAIRVAMALDQDNMTYSLTLKCEDVQLMR